MFTMKFNASDVSSRSIRVTKLSFCQSDSPLSESSWQKNSLVTNIFFDLCLFKHFSPVANFGQQMGSNNRFLNNYSSNHSWMFFEALRVKTKYQWINEFLDTILNSQQNYLVIAFQAFNIFYLMVLTFFLFWVNTDGNFVHHTPWRWPLK